MRGPWVTNGQILEVLRDLLPGLPTHLRKLQLTMGIGMYPVLEVEETVREAGMTVIRTKIFEINFVGEKPPMVAPDGDTTSLEDSARRRVA